MARKFRARKSSPTRKAYLAGVKAGKRTAYKKMSYKRFKYGKGHSKRRWY